MTTIPQKGAIVAVPSPKEAAEVYEVRALLEGLAAREFARNASEGQVAALREAFAQVARAGGADDAARVAGGEEPLLRRALRRRRQRDDPQDPRGPAGEGRRAASDVADGSRPPASSRSRRSARSWRRSSGATRTRPPAAASFHVRQAAQTAFGQIGSLRAGGRQEGRWLRTALRAGRARQARGARRASTSQRSLARASDFVRPMQEFVTEYCWGAIWSRPGLGAPRAQPGQPRGADGAQPLPRAGRPRRGAVRNGCTRRRSRRCCSRRRSTAASRRRWRRSASPRRRSRRSSGSSRGDGAGPPAPETGPPHRRTTVTDTARVGIVGLGAMGAPIGEALLLDAGHGARRLRQAAPRRPAPLAGRTACRDAGRGRRHRRDGARQPADAGRRPEVAAGNVAGRRQGRCGRSSISRPPAPRSARRSLHCSLADVRLPRRAGERGRRRARGAHARRSWPRGTRRSRPRPAAARDVRGGRLPGRAGARARPAREAPEQPAVGDRRSRSPRRR